MTAWIANGSRLDVELAVALEIAALRMARSTTAAEREEALAYNLRLWRSIRHLAAGAPDMEDREGLAATAGLVEGERDGTLLAERNVAHAGKLAGRAATQGALRRLLEQWSHHRRSDASAEFSRWLLDRMDYFVHPLSV
jgi:hypothetical protein